MKEWGIVEPDWPKEPYGPWPFEGEEEKSWIEEEYDCKVTEEEKEEVIKRHAEFLKSKKWEEMSDQEIIDEMVKLFPEIFAQKLSKERKIKGDAVKLAYKRL